MANSSKTKEPLKFGWLKDDSQYHITKITKIYNSHYSHLISLAHVCLCDTSIFVEYADVKNINWYSNWFIWPDGAKCIEVLCKDTICKKCLNLYKEDLTFPLIKAKLGVKNPFD